LRQKVWQRDTGKETTGPNAPVSKALHQLREALCKELNDLERKLQLSRERNQPGVEQRKELAKSLKLGERLLRIVTEIKYYPSWSERDPAWVCDLVSTISVTEKSVHDYTVEFEFNNRQYAIEYEKEWFIPPLGDESGPYYGHITLRSREGVELFTEGFRESEYGLVEFLDIDAFQLAGWLEDLLELAERIDALKRERELRRELEKIETQRKRFGLDLEVASPNGDRLTDSGLHGESEPQSLALRLARTMARCVRFIRLPRHSSKPR
jgi:hypothetical protein